MPLLGQGWDDPQSAAIMALAGGLLQGNFGAGLLGANQAYSEARKGLLGQELGKLQLENLRSEIDQRKAAMDKQKQIMGLLPSILGGGGYAQAQPGQMGSGTMGILPPPAGQSDMPAQRQPGIGGADFNTITMLHALGGPDLTNAFKIAREGFERKPGTFYDDVNGRRSYVADPTKGFDFQNGQVTELPNFSRTNAAIQGAQKLAEKRAEAAVTPLSLDFVRNGKPVGGSVLDYLDTQEMPNQGGGQLTPELSQFIRQDAARNGIANPQASFTGGGGNSTYGLGGQQPASIMRNSGQLQSKAEAAGAQARAEGEARLPFQTAEKVNETWLKTSYEPTLTAGNAAVQTMTNTRVARDALGKIGNSGWGTEAQAYGASVLNGLGIAPEKAKQFAANAETFQQASMTNLWSRLNAAKGPQTEGDADRASKTFAQLKNTPQANEFILDLTEANAQWDKMKSDFFQKALPIARQKGDLQEVEREWLARAPSVFSLPTMQRWGVK